MATRVTPLREKWRTAVTERRAPGRSDCANNMGTDTASAAISFIQGSLCGNVAHAAVGLHNFLYVVGTSELGLRLRLGPDLRGPYSLLLGSLGLLGLLQLPGHQDQVILRFGERRHAAIPGHRRLAGIVRRQRQRVIPPIEIQQVL